MKILAPLPKGVHRGEPFVWIATLFGVGRLPYAPGSWGSLFALILVFPLHLFFGVMGIVAFIILTLVLGLWSAGRFSKSANYSDPRAVVIDEAAGQSAALLLAEPLLSDYALAFLLFRLFDIWKPWPVSYVEEKLPTPYGVMCDDLAAALYALLFFYAIGIGERLL